MLLGWELGRLGCPKSWDQLCHVTQEWLNLESLLWCEMPDF